MNSERPCERLRSDVAFVGHVTSLVPEQRVVGHMKWTTGYSMRFLVEISIKGKLSGEISIHTGTGGGDCGTPLAPGGSFIIFAYKDENGILSTGMCNGNRELTSTPEEEKEIKEYQSLAGSGLVAIFGHAAFVQPHWKGDDVEDESKPRPVGGLTIHATGKDVTQTTTTSADGSYAFEGLPDGKYTISPEISDKLDFDREHFEDRYQPNLSAGECRNVSFTLEPVTRIRGHVTLPAGFTQRSIEVEAIPITLKNVNQFSGKWDFTDPDGRFDLWPLPPGDYYVGVNINSSPKAQAPFHPTYFPGVINRLDAAIVHVGTNEVKEIELPIREIAKTRQVRFVAIGMDGKPMKKIYVQLEDLRHPGDAFSNTNVDLDQNGAGELRVFAGYAYHLHASLSVIYGNDWCAKPVAISAGSAPVEVRFVMDRQDASCDLRKIDHTAPPRH